MGFSVTILHTATIELSEAIDWYEDQKPFLGLAFYNEFLSCISKLEANPQHYGFIYKNYRQILVKRFPYKLIFLIETDKVIVHVVAHSKREEGELFKRL